MLAAGGGRTLSVAFHMKTDDAVGALLRTAPYFSGLSGDVLTIVARRCQSKTFRAGQVVFMEGNPCRHLHIPESGRVKFFRTSAEGREQILKVFERPGDTFCIPSAFHTLMPLSWALSIGGVILLVRWIWDLWGRAKADLR